MPRHDGRRADQLRPVTLEPGAQRHPAGSALVRFGATHVLCAASCEDGAPRFRNRLGWVTGEYAMLPGSTDTRSRRERNGPGGRSKEIERLIGRSLRAVVDLDALPDVTITVDCDVLEADGAKISMTAPVLQSRDGAHEMVFVLPDDMTPQTAPVPTDPAVSLATIPPRRVAVVRYSGFLSRRASTEEARLRDWLARKGLRATGPAEVAGYNPPWTLPPLRRNEVLIPVETD